MFFKRQQPETPLYPLTKYAREITTLTEYAFGETVTFIQPTAITHLTDAEQRVLELERSGFWLAQTFVVPDKYKILKGQPGNLQVFRIDPKQEAVNGLLRTLAETRITAAIDQYGADNVVTCRSTEYALPAISAYEQHEYLALYVRNEVSSPSKAIHPPDEIQAL